MNLFGFDVQTLDVTALIASVQVLWWLSCAAAVFVLARKGAEAVARPWRILIALAVLGHFFAWFVTMFPLPNTYGVNGSLDRENHLGWIEVIVAGNSPLRSFQVDQIHFEPLWPNLIALLSLKNPENIGVVLQTAPLAIGILFILSVFVCVAKGLSDEPESRMEGAFAAFFALLMASAYIDQTAPFRNPWALTFLLKPNHALGLALTPLVLLALSRVRSGRGHVGAVFLLLLLGWVFIVHMAFVISGLLVFAAVSWRQRNPERGQMVRDLGVVIALSVALLSPYFFMLREFVAATSVQARLGIQPQSAHTLDATLRLGLVFPLAVFGAWSLFAGASAFGKILASQFVAAQVNWQIYHLLGFLQLGKEMDEAFYWIRFITALVAGIGFFRLGRAALARVKWQPSGATFTLSATAALLLALVTPATLPAWWNPDRMDRYFEAARRPQPERVTAPARFLRDQTERSAVVAGDRVYARYVAAFGARRVLLAESLAPPWDFEARSEVEAAITRGAPASLIADGRVRYGIRYLLVTPSFLDAYPGVTLEGLRGRKDLQLVFEHGRGPDRVSIFEILPG